MPAKRKVAASASASTANIGFEAIERGNPILKGVPFIAYARLGFTQSSNA